MKYLTEEERRTLSIQIRQTATEMGLVPEGYRLIVAIERVANRRDPAPEGHRSSQARAALLLRPLMDVYRDPENGVRIQDRTKYGRHIESVITHPPSNTEGEINTLGGFAQTLHRLRARLGEDLCRHLSLWFQKLGVPYAQRPTFSYAQVED